MGRKCKVNKIKSRILNLARDSGSYVIERHSVGELLQSHRMPMETGQRVVKT